MRYIVLVAILVSCLLQIAAGQRLPPPLVSSDSHPGGPATDTATLRADNMAVAGILGGVAGLYLGARVGLAANPRCWDDGCLFDALAWAAFVGEPLGVALGVHLAGGRHGNYGLEAATAAGISIVGVLVAAALENHNCNGCSAVPLISIPIAQLVATVAMERAATSHDP